MQNTPVAKVEFDITHHPTRISVVEELKGKSGWLVLQRLAIDSFEREDYLLFSAFADAGTAIDQETCEKLFYCKGRTLPCPQPVDALSERLENDADRHVKATVAKSLEQNSKFFNEAREKLDKWADDQVIAVEKELKDVKDDIRFNNRQARLATTVEDQLKYQEKIRELETKKRRLRQRIFDVEDEIIAKRDSLISALERRMSQRTSVEILFTIRWSVV